MKISGIVRQAKNDSGKTPAIKGATVTLIVGERELGVLTTDRMGRYEYKEDSDYPGASLICRVTAPRYEPKEEKVVLTHTELQLDVELVGPPDQKDWAPWMLWVAGLLGIVLVIVVLEYCSIKPAETVTMWKPLEPQAFTKGNAQNVRMKVANGVPYVAFKDQARKGMGTVMKYEADKWMPVGTPGLSSGELFFSLSLAVDGKNPWVAYADSTEGYKLAVRQFTNNMWEAVGSPEISRVRVNGLISLELQQGNPVVGYWTTVKGEPNRAYVQKFDGKQWKIMGDKPIVEGMISHFKLAVDGHDMYTASAIGKDRAMSIRHFHDDHWETFGSKDDSSLPIKLATHVFDFIAHKGEAFLAFSNQDQEGRLTVVKVNQDGFKVLGSSPAISVGVATFPSLAVSDDVVYVGFKDKKQLNKSVVYEFKKNESTWELVDKEFADPKSSGLALAVDDKGVPYVAYQEGRNKDWKLTVMRGEQMTVEKEN